jgi:hypothetical protein
MSRGLEVEGVPGAVAAAGEVMRETGLGGQGEVV